MKRSDFLKGLAAAGAATTVPWNKARASGRALPPIPGGGCWLTPQETEGPFYFDPGLIRVDITEGYPGTPFHWLITVINEACQPIPNVLVDVWHCDKDGVYSGYPGQVGGLDTTGMTFLRGTQITDGNGQVQFSSIYPGWYPGRATHVHFKVRLSAITYVTGQWAFLNGQNDLVHASPPYTVGINPTQNQDDGIFNLQAEPTYEIMDCTPDGLGGYNGTYTIGIAGASAVGVNQLDLGAGTQFSMGVNQPNPFSDRTVIPFGLKTASHVRLELLDLNGRSALLVMDQDMSAGEHQAVIDSRTNGSVLQAGSYLYMMTVSNPSGIFRQLKRLDLLR